MKNIKLKYSIIFFSYAVLIFCTIISYVSVIPIPEETIPVLKNNDPLIEEIIDNSVDKNIVYEILEKEKERPKSIDELIEKEVKLEEPLIAKDKKNNVNNNFKIQLASFKKKEKSHEISKILKKKLFHNSDLELIIKRIVLENKQVYHRVLINNNFTLEEARSLCAKITQKKYQCLIIMDS